MAAYYLGDLGASKQEILKAGEVIGEKDRIALQRYYCGGNYNRRECRVYASGVEAKARLARVALLQAGLGDQLRVLEEQRREIKQSIEKTFIKTSAQYVPPITCNGNIHTIPVQEGEQMVLLIFKERNRQVMERLQNEGLVARVYETSFEFPGNITSPNFSSEATYYGGEVVGTSYITEYEPDRVQWIAFVHQADEDTVKARIGSDLKIIPSWINRGPGSAVVEFRCGENLPSKIPAVISPVIPQTSPVLREPPAPPVTEAKEPIWPPAIKISNSRPAGQTWLAAVLKRRNGELFASFNISRVCKQDSNMEACLADKTNEGLWGSVSKDEGESWSAPFFIYDRRPSSPSSYSIIEDLNGNLILLIEGLLGEKITFISKDGRVWENRREVAGLMGNTIAGSIIHSSDGYYYVSYSV